MTCLDVPAKPLLLVVAAALLDAEGRILLTQRPAGKAMAGLWEFPGGKLELGETPEQALVRELGEELGLTIAPTDLLPLTFASYAYPDVHILMPLYVCRVWHGTPEGREGQALAWVGKGDLRNYTMPPADEPLVPILCDLLKS